VPGRDVTFTSQIHQTQVHLTHLHSSVSKLTADGCILAKLAGNLKHFTRLKTALAAIITSLSGRMIIPVI
jgi:hypothetical protein